MESQQNVRKLTNDLKHLKYQNLDVFSVKDGDPIVFLQILQFLLDHFLVKDVGFYGTTDEQFINKFYLFLRDRYNYKPKLSQTQFFKPGFVNAKCELAIDFIKMLKGERKVNIGSNSSQERLEIIPQPKPEMPELTANDSLLNEQIPKMKKSNTKASDNQLPTEFDSKEVSVVSEDDKYSTTNKLGQQAPPGFLFSFDEIRDMDKIEKSNSESKKDSIFNQENKDIFKSGGLREGSVYSDDSLKNKQRVVDAVISSKNKNEQKSDIEKSMSWGSSTSEYYLQGYFQGYRDTETKPMYSVASSIRSYDIPEEHIRFEPVSLGSSDHEFHKRRMSDLDNFNNPRRISMGSSDHDYYYNRRRTSQGVEYGTHTPQPSTTTAQNPITIIKDKTPKQKTPLRFTKDSRAEIKEEPSLQAQLDQLQKKLNTIDSKLDQFTENQMQIQHVILLIGVDIYPRAWKTYGRVTASPKTDDSPRNFRQVVYINDTTRTRQEFGCFAFNFRLQIIFC